MASRIDLHNVLVNILGSRNVYFQPPESIKINYPCIIYSRSKMNSTVASNMVYVQNFQYEIVTVYKDPDSDLPKKMSKELPCRHMRHYTSDGLHHDVFTYTIQNT